MSTNISPYRHIIESQQFNEEFLAELFETTRYMKKNKFKVENLLKGRIGAMLFYEPSTRTRLSFESASYKLGANVISTENAKEFSSAAKGETLQDTIKVISGYADFIVLRHYEDDSSEIAASVSKVPIINAGSGTEQHPTQALLDVYTIDENFGTLENLNIVFIGDILRGRTVNSLVYLLSKPKGNKFDFISPENSRIKEGIKVYLKEHNLKFTETEDLEGKLKKADVVYMTRIQKERFVLNGTPKDSEEYRKGMIEYEKAKGMFILNNKNVSTMKKDAIIMHPLPRVDEIHPEVDSDLRAKYFEQAENGLYVRMALLKILDDHN